DNAGDVQQNIDRSVAQGLGNVVDRLAVGHINRMQRQFAGSAAGDLLELGCLVRVAAECVDMIAAGHIVSDQSESDTTVGTGNDDIGHCLFSLMKRDE